MTLQIKCQADISNIMEILVLIHNLAICNIKDGIFKSCDYDYRLKVDHRQNSPLKTDSPMKRSQSSKLLLIGGILYKTNNSRLVRTSPNVLGGKTLRRRSNSVIFKSEYAVINKKNICLWVK